MDRSNAKLGEGAKLLYILRLASLECSENVLSKYCLQQYALFVPERILFCLD